MGWFGDLIGAGASLIGGMFASDANEEAADASIEASRNALQAHREGNAIAQEHLKKLERNAAPGVAHLQQIVAGDPNRITPAQEIQLADTSRNLNAGLAKSGLRGAGRSVARVHNDVMNRTKSGMVERNRGRVDTAATNLAGQATGAATGQANLASQLGQQTANTLTGMGDTTANAATANGSLWAQTLGNIGSIFARDDRGSRYDS